MKKMILGLVLLTAFAGYADTSSVIATTDKTCHVFYPSGKDTSGWTMQLKSGTCVKGAVQGAAVLTFYNGFHTPQEEISGTFSQGYWTDIALTQPFHQLSQDKDKNWKLTFDFDIGIDGIQATGQLVSAPTQGLMYQPFSFCSPVRLLLKTKDTSLFETKDMQRQLIDRLEPKIAYMCPQMTKILLFAVPENASEDEAMFYAQWTPKQKEYAFYPLKQTKTPVPPKKQEPLLTDMVQAQTTLSPAAHLFLESKVKGTPMTGTSVFHILPSGATDSPFPVQLVGNTLTGWVQITGDFFAPKMTALPFVQVRHEQACSRPFCGEAL